MDTLFANPIMLWGLIFLSVPVLLHLLLRKPQQIENWGAMQFLERVLKKQRRRLQFQSLLQLVLRMLIIAGVVTAAANPVLNAVSDQPANPSRHHVILIDQSLSTRAYDGEITAFQRQLLYLEKLIENTSIGDSFQIMLHGTRSHRFIDRPTYDRQSVLRELKKLSAGHGVGRLDLSVQRVQSLFKHVEEDRLITVHVLTDLQQREWKAGSKPDSALRKQFHALEKRAQVRIVDVGTNDLGNIVLTNLSLDTKRPKVDEDHFVQVDLENFSSAASTVSVELKLDGISLNTQSLIVPERSTTSVQFPIKFTEPGPHILEASTSTDALVDDNKRWHVLDIVNEFKVLIIQQPLLETESDTDKRAKFRAADYLQLAFSERIQKTVIDLGDLNQHSLESYDIIIATDISAFTSTEARLLHEFVQSGGGLALVLGETVQPQNYNTQLGVGEEGLLPATIREEIKTAEESPFLFTPVDREHPLLEQFQDHPEAGLETTRVYRYRQVEIGSRSQAGTERIIDSSDGSPLLISKPFGQGKVMLITTSLDERWGSWIAWPSFVPLMNELVFYLGKGTTTFEESLVTSPFPQPDTTEIEWIGPLITFDETPSEEVDSETLPGVYINSDSDFESKRDGPSIVVRQIDTRDSDLLRLDKATLAEMYFENDLSVFQSISQDQGTTSHSLKKTPSPVTMALLGTTLVLFLLEQSLQRYFAESVSILVALMFSLLVMLLLPTSPILIASVSGIVGLTTYWLQKRSQLNRFPLQF